MFYTKSFVFLTLLGSVAMLAFPSAGAAQNDPPSDVVARALGKIPQAAIETNISDPRRRANVKMPAIPEDICGDYANLPTDLAGRTLRALKAMHCAEGIWDDGGLCPDGDICAIWCTLKSSHTMCINLGIVSFCWQHCHYGDCGTEFS